MRLERSISDGCHWHSASTPHHLSEYGRNGISQEVLGGWLGLTQAQISRIENGPPVRHLDSLTQWARTLGIPEHLLWFKLPERQPDGQPGEAARQAQESAGDRTQACIVQSEHPDSDAVNRREFLRLLSIARALVASGPVEDLLDWERPQERCLSAGPQATRRADRQSAQVA